jgi:hypothetical protein
LVTLVLGLIGNIFIPGFMDGPFKWVIMLFVGLWAVIFAYTTFINSEFGVKDYHSYAIKARFWELVLGKDEAVKFTRGVVKSWLGKILGVVLILMGIGLILTSLYKLFY